MEARHPGTCPRCSLPYEAGEQIDLLKPEDRWGHRSCPGEISDIPDVPDDLPYPLPLSAEAAAVEPGERIGFSLGGHTYLGEEDRYPTGWRWVCSCGGHGQWRYEGGYGWHLWLGHVTKKTSGTDWDSYHTAKALRELP